MFIIAQLHLYFSIKSSITALLVESEILFFFMVKKNRDIFSEQETTNDAATIYTLRYIVSIFTYLNY